MPRAAEDEGHMSKGAKIVLVVLAIGCGGGALVLAGVGYFVWQKGPEIGKQIEKRADDAAKAGETYGQANTATACVDESLRRASACGQLELPCLLKERLFLSGCLPAAKDPESLCTNATRRDAWVVERCAAAGPMPEGVCPAQLEEALSFCERRK